MSSRHLCARTRYHAFWSNASNGVTWPEQLEINARSRVRARDGSLPLCLLEEDHQSSNSSNSASRNRRKTARLPRGREASTNNCAVSDLPSRIRGKSQDGSDARSYDSKAPALEPVTDSFANFP